MAKIDRATVNLHFMTRHYLGEIKGEGPLTRGVRIDHIDRRTEAAESEKRSFTGAPEGPAEVWDFGAFPFRETHQENQSTGNSSFQWFPVLEARAAKRGAKQA